MSRESSQKFLWECVEALAGYTAADPKRIVRVLCPRCSGEIESIVRENEDLPIYESFGSPGPIMVPRPPQLWVEPCRHRITSDEANAMIEVFNSRTPGHNHFGRFQ